MNFPPLPLPFDLPNSCTEQFIATLLSSLSTEIKVSVSFSLNPSPPYFFSFSISLYSAWLPQPVKSFNTVLEKALGEKTPGMFKEKVECSVCQTELGHTVGGAIPQRGYFPL